MKAKENLKIQRRLINTFIKLSTNTNVHKIIILTCAGHQHQQKAEVTDAECSNKNGILKTRTIQCFQRKLFLFNFKPVVIKN